jgi:hypothetical protein
MAVAPLDLHLADVDPWERLPGETARAFAAFVLYRDAGPTRSLVGAYRTSAGRPEVVGKALPGYWREWARANQWQERAAAWDREQDRLARRRQVDAVRQMNERQAGAGVTLQARSLAVLARLLPTQKELDAAEADGANAALERVLARVTPSELLRALDLGTKTERLSRGEATEVTDQHVRASIRPMSDDEARAYAGLD